MKKAIILIILLILLVPIGLAKTETVELRTGDSRLIEDSNVTLLSINERDNKIIVCVNSQKQILEEKQEKTVNNLRIDVKDVKYDYAKLTLDSDCRNCICNTNECSNAACFSDVKEVIEEDKTGLPNPASVYCEEQGGISEIRYLEDGSQVGYCIFDDFECEEFAFYNKECPQKQTEEQGIWNKIISWFRSLF